MATDSNADDGTHGRSIRFSVHDRSLPVVGAICVLYHGPADQTKGRQRPVAYEATGEGGEGVFRKLKPGLYTAYCLHQRLATAETVLLEAGDTPYARFDLNLGMSARITLLRDGSPNSAVAFAHEGDVAELAVSFERDGDDVVVVHPTGAKVEVKDARLSYSLIRSAGPHQLHFSALVPLSPRQLAQHPEAVPLRAPPDNRARISDQRGFSADARPPQTVDGNLAVSLQRGSTTGTPDLAFWQGILNSTEQMGFNNYLRFMNMLFCGDEVPSDLPVFERDRFDEKRELSQRLFKRRLLPFTDSDAYRAVKAATEAFVMVNCGVLAEPRPFDDRRDAAHLRRRDLPVPFGGLESVFTEDYLVQILGGDAGDRTLPYLAVIRSKLPDIAIKLESLGVDPLRVGQCTGILQEKLTHPCMLELIWSYWHEEGMLVQTMNSIARRFQNVRSGERDPLANMEIDPLRPLHNVLWGYVQDEQHRLSIVRRNYEYDHHYGLRLEGKAVARMQSADSRSRFIEAFHSLLRYCTTFYRQDDDTTVKADAFPVLNALKEVHLILSQGAHNQFGDLPSTARIEMMMQQWMLARPEFREFLPTRIMTAYPEPWMDRVDAMKKVQGWTDTSVLHFRNLAKFGEQLLLSIRWGHWSDVQDPLQAFNWARFFRPQAQGYCHAYRAVTGVELALELADAKIDATLPSVLLQRRLATQQRVA